MADYKLSTGLKTTSAANTLDLTSAESAATNHQLTFIPETSATGTVTVTYKSIDGSGYETLYEDDGTTAVIINLASGEQTIKTSGLISSWKFTGTSIVNGYTVKARGY